MSRIHLLARLWILTSRPLLYPLIPLIFILGYQAGGGSLTDWLYQDWLFVLMLTWPFGMVVYGINDVSDSATDYLDHDRSRFEGGAGDKSNNRSIILGVCIAVVLMTLVASVAYGWLGFIFSVLVLFASLIYSVAPFRLKGRAGLDVLFSGIVYVCFIYGFGYWLVKPFSSLPESVYILAMLAVSLHALGTLRDYTVDHQARVRTLAVALGPRLTSASIVIITLMGMTLWQKERGLDLAAQLLFISILVPALLTIRQPNERLVRIAMRVTAILVAVVGLFKVLF